LQATGSPAALQPADDRPTQPRHHPFNRTRIMDKVCLIKGRAQNRSVSNLTAISASHTTLVDMRDRIITQRIIQRLQGQ
jgi:hypothetical protein